MAPTKVGKANEKNALFMMTVLENMEGKPKVDWEAVAKAMSLKNAGVASVRFGQIKKKLGRKSGDAGTGGAPIISGFTSVNKVTKRKASTTGSARAKRASKASAKVEVAQDDELGSGGVDSNDNSSDETKHEEEGKGDNTTTDLLAALKAEMNEEDEASLNADHHDV